MVRIPVAAIGVRVSGDLTSAERNPHSRVGLPLRNERLATH